jgi:phosphatidylserine/phosphatidylglycerophosphate/cardiolipin synthase-like enzyme
MSEVIIDGGVMNVPAEAPMTVDISNPEKLLMPFDGTVVLSSKTLTPSFTGVGIHDYQFLQYRNTAKGESDDAIVRYEFPGLRTIHNKVFTTTKNHVVLVQQESILLEFAGSEPRIGSIQPGDPDFDETPILGIHKFDDNVIASTYPRVLILEFAEGAPFTENLKFMRPQPTASGVDLKTAVRQGSGNPAAEIPTSCRVYAFDLSGYQTEALAALRNLGVRKEIRRVEADEDKMLVQFVDLHGNPMNLEDFPLNQLVIDPLERSVLPAVGGEDPVENPYYYFPLGAIENISFTLPEFVGDSKDRYLHDNIRVAIWPGRDTGFKEVVEVVPTEIKLFHNIKPGPDDEVPPPLEMIELNDLMHKFVRLCVFHPSMEFQTIVGGQIRQDPGNNVNAVRGFRFNKNHFHYHSDRNKVEVFNSGDDFFTDLHKTIGGLKEGDHWFQTNWKASSHLHMTGTAAVRRIVWKYFEAPAVREEVDTLTDGMRMVPVYPVTNGKQEFYFSPSGDDIAGNGSPFNPFQSVARLNVLLMNSLINDGDLVFFERGGDFSGTDVVTEEVPTPSFKPYGDLGLEAPVVQNVTVAGAADLLLISGARSYMSDRNTAYELVVNTTATILAPAKKLHSGFVRADNLPSLRLSGSLTPETGGAFAVKLTATWKDPTRRVLHHSVLKELQTDDNLSDLKPFASNTFTLDIGNGALPKARLTRHGTYAELAASLDQVGSEDLHLLIFNPAAGTHHFLPLRVEGEPDVAQQVLSANVGLEDGLGVHPFALMAHANDALQIAIVGAPPEADYIFDRHLLTAFRELKFTNKQHRQGLVPMHDGELCGLLRTAISKGIDVKALFWEQSLTALKPDATNYIEGESNNRKVTEIINTPIIDPEEEGEPRRGYAMLDRATRQSGSFHQKVTVIVSTARNQVGEFANDLQVTVTAYVGGMDLAIGRWDTRFHNSNDPDRQSNPWIDAQVKITGDAAYDLLRNFKQRWESVGKFSARMEPAAIQLKACTPLNWDEFPRVLPEHAEIGVPEEEIAPRLSHPGKETLVQVSRTIPPFGCHVNNTPASEEARITSEKLIVGEEGELGILASYLKALDNARRFVFINEQYFYSEELALKLHNRLTDLKNPIDFVIVVTPKIMGEDATIDPLLYKQRQKAMEIVVHGAESNSVFEELGLDETPLTEAELSEPSCGKYKVKSHSPDDKGVAHKVVFMYPVNKLQNEAKNHVYVHSKHIIVDDVWMTIGSSNMGARSMTYDWEIDAAMVDLKLHKGGTMTVRNQRIELMARMFGIPLAYSAAFQDPYAAFQVLKNMEKNAFQNVYPTKPGVRILNPKSIPGSPGAFVINADINSTTLSWVVCNVLDPDGRNQNSDRIGFFAEMFGIGKHTPDGVLNVIFAFDNAIRMDIVQRLQNDEHLMLRVQGEVTSVNDENQLVTGPLFELDRFALTPNEDNDHPILDGVPLNNLGILVNADVRLRVVATVTDEDGVPQDWSGEIGMVPNDLDNNLVAGEYPSDFGAQSIDQVLNVVLSAPITP